jgi:hypothetical protein
MKKETQEAFAFAAIAFSVMVATVVTAVVLVNYIDTIFFK